VRRYLAGVAETGARDRPDIPSQALRGPALENFQLEYREPSAQVEDIVDYHWIVEWSVPAGEERVQPVVTHPSIHLTVEGDQATVTGVVTRCFRRTLVGSGRVVGVRFRPSGFSALSPAPASGLTDEALPAADVLGAEAARELAGVGAGDPSVDVDEAIRRMEAVLQARRRPRPRGAAVVDEAVDHIVARADVTRVEQVARHLGVSARTLQRRFERFLGVGPKWVIQRRRIHEALEEIEHGRAMDWTALALRLGFADQAHFVHAFTELIGQPPSSYEERRPLH
jgi:AraC-like DNA-binding protein